MNFLSILEDRSPYYIRFRYSFIDTIVNECLSYSKYFNLENQLKILPLTEQSQNIINNNLPYPKEYENIHKKMALFITGSNFYMRVHKDGKEVSTALNFAILNVDDKCVTNWYDETDLSKYNIRFLSGGKVRDLENFNKVNHQPIVSSIAKVGECVLVNQEIFHDFDNSLSLHNRVILHVKLDIHSFTFDDHKKLLFPHL